MRYAKIGGQALIEGIMMRFGEDYSVAVRKPDHTIEVKRDKHVSLAARLHVSSVPIVRGALAFIDSLVLGMSTLTYSASFFEEEEESSGEKDAGEKKSDSLLMALTVLLSIVIAVALFMLLPYFISVKIAGAEEGTTLMALIEGIVRVVIFLLYIVAISRMKDIQRVFMYHGAEHKTISCIEHGMELTPENAAKCSRLHKRCGTSFLLFVVIISILFFMFIRTDSQLMRILLRVLLVPVIAGVSYELLQWAGRSDSALMNIISTPGLWLQKLTTREPDEQMLEVAIASIEAIYDWRAFQAGEEDKAAICGCPDPGGEP